MLMNPLSVIRRPRLAAPLSALLATLFFSSCESPLSDVEITDPGTLITTFSVDRTMLDDGTVNTGLSATLLDKNLASIELKNGQVKVNGQEMSVYELLNISTYHIPEATVSLNTQYNFEVVLANGESYAGTVMTPDKTFTSFTVPTNATRDSDLTISWQDVYVYDEFIITTDLTSPTGAVVGPQFTLTPEQMHAGSFVIPKSTFATPEGITSVKIALVGVEYGTIDSKFHSGSGTLSRMRVEKNVTFN